MPPYSYREKGKDRNRNGNLKFDMAPRNLIWRLEHFTRSPGGAKEKKTFLQPVHNRQTRRLGSRVRPCSRSSPKPRFLEKRKLLSISTNKSSNV